MVCTLALAHADIVSPGIIVPIPGKLVAPAEGHICGGLQLLVLVMNASLVPLCVRCPCCS